MAARFVIPADGGSEEAVTEVVRRVIIILTLIGIVTFLGTSGVAHGAPASPAPSSVGGAVHHLTTTAPALTGIDTVSLANLLRADQYELRQLRNEANTMRCVALAVFYNGMVTELNRTSDGHVLVVSAGLDPFNC